MIASFFMVFKIMENINNKYLDIININITISKLSKNINENLKTVEEHIRNPKEETYQQYISSKSEINRLIKKLDGHVNVDKDTSIYYRTLCNMTGYYNKLTGEILESKFDLEAYNKYLTVKRLYLIIQNYIQMLSESFLLFSSEKHTELIVESNSYEIGAYMVVITFAFLSIVFAVTYSTDMIRKIDEVSNTADKLAHGYWEVKDISSSKYHELDVVARAFNNMKQNIKTFIEELKEKTDLEIKLNKEILKSVEKDRTLKESQLQALQMQMDPHFLFNTLNIIARMSMFEGANTSEKLIQAMSKILRYNLSNNGDLVNIYDEIESIKNYLTIQEIRFQDQMVFNLEIGKNLNNVYIPPMIIQPIVENAIIHGLKNRVRDGIVDIKVEKRDDYAIIEVSDNGKGIDDEIIENILKNNLKKDKESTKVGLLNVKKRLELIFGQENLLQLENRLNGGTKVKILVPLGSVKSSMKNIK
jgi:sensor histidine kinase YesM